MSKSLAIGYSLFILVIAAVILLARGILPKLDGITTFAVAQAVGLLLFPASIFLFRGENQATISTRKWLGLASALVAFLLGIASTIALALILLGKTQQIG